MRTIKVFVEGKQNCEHDWIYNKPKNMRFTTPMVSSQERICEDCGRFEIVEVIGNVEKFDTERFTVINNE